MDSYLDVPCSACLVLSGSEGSDFEGQVKSQLGVSQVFYTVDSVIALHVSLKSQMENEEK